MSILREPLGGSPAVGQQQQLQQWQLQQQSHAVPVSPIEFDCHVPLGRAVIGACLGQWLQPVVVEQPVAAVAENVAEEIAGPLAGQAGEEVVAEEEPPWEEARRARKARDPGAPSVADWDAHQATHLPFRI